MEQCLLPNNSKHFFEFQWTLEQRENSQTENSQVKVRKVSINKGHITLLSTILEFK